MNAFRLIVAVCVGAPLSIILFLMWLPLAALEKAANAMRKIIDAADAFIAKLLIDPITRNKK